LVQQVLKDPNINIRVLPDQIERKLYETTVRLTLNAIYKIFQELNGKPIFLGYQLQLQQYPQSVGKTKAFREASVASNHVNYHSLEQVADRLLQNPIINQPLIPDVLERQIYINSLKVAFRVLDILQSSLRIRICGHWLGLSLAAGDDSDDNYDSAKESAVTRATNILAQITIEDLMQYQKDAGIDDWNDFGKRRFFGWIRPEPLLAQVHSTLFGLVFHTVQDIMDHSAIEMVGVGKIVMDLVPPSGNNTTTNKSGRAVTKRQSRLQSFPVSATFVSGIGVGIVVTLLFQNYGQEIQYISAKFSKCILPLLQGIGSGFHQIRGAIFSRLAGIRRNKKTNNEEDDDNHGGFYVAGVAVRQVVYKKYPDIGL
jgi:F0F1-type ATP synthase assembly protein I